MMIAILQNKQTTATVSTTATTVAVERILQISRGGGGTLIYKLYHYVPRNRNSF